MGKSFRADELDQSLLFPPSLHDWLPDNHLCPASTSLSDRVASFRNVTGELRAFLSRIRRRRVDEKPINRQAILQDTEPGW
jgi:hypothetical protein